MGQTTGIETEWGPGELNGSPPLWSPCTGDHPCISVTDAIERLRWNLELSGGSLEDDCEPGLPVHQSRSEDHLRQVIRFLQTLAIFAAFGIETAGAHTPFMKILYQML